MLQKTSVLKHATHVRKSMRAEISSNTIFIGAIKTTQLQESSFDAKLCYVVIIKVVIIVFSHNEIYNAI